MLNVEVMMRTLNNTWSTLLLKIFFDHKEILINHPSYPNYWIFWLVRVKLDNKEYRTMKLFTWIHTQYRVSQKNVSLKEVDIKKVDCKIHRSPYCKQYQKCTRPYRSDNIQKRLKGHLLTLIIPF